MSIKYYRLAKDEEPPEEFCAVRDVGGEPSEYVFYVPEHENAKLRELVRDAWGDGHPDRSCDGCDIRDECHDDVERIRKDGVLRFSRCLFELRIEDRMRELGVEVEA